MKTVNAGVEYFSRRILKEIATPNRKRQNRKEAEIKFGKVGYNYSCSEKFVLLDKNFASIFVQ